MIGDDQGFIALARPVVSPDGQRIAFSAVGGRDAADGPPPQQPAGLGSQLTPPVAYAHGVPWEIWTIGADGNALRRLTDIAEDSPYAAWSPDGHWIAFSGEMGVYMVDPEGRQVRRIAEEFAEGGITWLPG